MAEREELFRFDDFLLNKQARTLDRVLPDIDAMDLSRPGIRAQQSGRHRERRRLARAIAAEERRGRSTLHREADAAHRLDLRIALAQVAHDDRRIVARGKRQHWIVLRQ